MSSRRKGHPPLYAAQAVFDRIRARIAKGESLAAICRDPSMPGESTVYRWLKSSHETEKLRQTLRRIESVPEVADKLKEPNTKAIDFADVVFRGSVGLTRPDSRTEA